MSRFYRIKLNDLHLSSDGTADGDPCKLSCDGADALALAVTGTTSVAVDGTPVNVLFDGGGGRVLEIKVETLEAAIYHAVVALINTALANSTTINIVGTGDILNFDVPVIPLFQPRPFEAKDFSGGRIKNAVFRFITV